MSYTSKVSCTPCRLSLLRRAATAVERLQEEQLQQLGGSRVSNRLCTPVELHERHISTIQAHADALVSQLQSAPGNTTCAQADVLASNMRSTHISTIQSHADARVAQVQPFKGSGIHDPTWGHDVRNRSAGASHRVDSSRAVAASMVKQGASHGTRVKALAAIEAAHRLQDLADSIAHASRGGGGGGQEWRLQARASLRLAADVAASCAAARCDLACLMQWL
jgi:hypothetical protein